MRWTLRSVIRIQDCLEHLLCFVRCTSTHCLVCTLNCVREGLRTVVRPKEMPCNFQISCLAIAVGSSCQPLPHPPMQMLPRRARYRVVRLRPDQLVAELETAMHLPQDTFLLQPGER